MSKFISFDGNDGCGKSTQIELLKEHLEKNGYEVVVLSPYTTDWGNALHLATIRKTEEEVPAAAGLLAFMANRQHLFETIVKPALAEGKFVITDRWDATSFAYNAFEKGNECLELFATCTRLRGKAPEVIHLEVPFAETMKRKGNRDVDTDRFDTNSELVFDKNRRGFTKFQTLFPSVNFHNVNGNQSVNKVHEEILKALCVDN